VYFESTNKQTNKRKRLEEVQSSGRSGIDLQLKMLLDPSCVGRVIGSAGATIVHIKKTAGASLAQVSKEPRVSISCHKYYI